MNIKNRPLRFLKIFKISIAFTIILAALLIIRTRGKLVSRRVDTQLAPTAPQALVNKSPVIRSITLEGDPNGLPIAISGSAGDLWFSTWADDGNLYTTWGDGRGFGEILSDIGIARLEGDLPLITGENVYFEKIPLDMVTGIICEEGTLSPKALEKWKFSEILFADLLL